MIDVGIYKENRLARVRSWTSDAEFLRSADSSTSTYTRDKEDYSSYRNVVKATEKTYASPFFARNTRYIYSEKKHLNFCALFGYPFLFEIFHIKKRNFCEAN